MEPTGMNGIGIVLRIRGAPAMMPDRRLNVSVDGGPVSRVGKASTCPAP